MIPLKISPLDWLDFHHLRGQEHLRINLTLQAFLRSLKPLVIPHICPSHPVCLSGWLISDWHGLNRLIRIVSLVAAPGQMNAFEHPEVMVLKAEGLAAYLSLLGLLEPVLLSWLYLTLRELFLRREYLEVRGRRVVHAHVVAQLGAVACQVAEHWVE